jgi:hypothetical protein
VNGPLEELLQALSPTCANRIHLVERSRLAMTVIIVGHHGIVGDLQGEIARLDNLLADLRHLAKGHMPTERNIGAAPVIEHWAEATRPEPCLVGRMVGHPDCVGPLSVTSGVWVYAPDFGWARTLSRFYRLGRPYGAGRPQ